MATTIAIPRKPPNERPFSGRRASDHDFFLAYVGFIWLAVLAGFVPEVIRHLQSRAAPYPIAVHVHAVITTAWLALLTSQTLLIRKQDVRLHRKWGTAGAFLAVAVVIVGLWAAFVFESRAMNTPAARPHFLAIAGDPQPHPSGVQPGDRKTAAASAARERRLADLDPDLRRHRHLGPGRRAV